MHGIVHSQLKNYVATKHGDDAWKAVLDEAGLSGKLYMTVGTYPDEEIGAVVKAASRLTDTPVERIMEDFGMFITPTLMNMYKSLIKPEWGTLEMLLNTEDTIHRVVRAKNPEAKPPRLEFEQTGSRELTLHYDSPRRMSAVAKGIIRGVAEHYGDTVAIREPATTNGQCEIVVEVK